MKTLTAYNNTNVTNTKQFVTASKLVFGSIAQRNDQVQQLLVIAVGEAARISGGQVTNNLDWLARSLNLIKLVIRLSSLHTILNLLQHGSTMVKKKQ